MLLCASFLNQILQSVLDCSSNLLASNSSHFLTCYHQTFLHQLPMACPHIVQDFCDIPVADPDLVFAIVLFSSIEIVSENGAVALVGFVAIDLLAIDLLAIDFLMLDLSVTWLLAIDLLVIDL